MSFTAPAITTPTDIEKTPIDERHPDQVWLFTEAKALAKAAESAPVNITIPTHERDKGGRGQLSAVLPRAEVVHDLPEAQKICAANDTAFTRSGDKVSERVIRNIRPKYARLCRKSGVAIAPVSVQLLPKSMATPSFPAQITTAKFVDGTPLHRPQPQLARLGVPLERATIAGSNRCENAIRPFVMSCKGWLFSDTVKGAISSANLYSIVDTAKANRVEPHAHLSPSFPTHL